jgi:hypothetical protein
MDKKTLDSDGRGQTSEDKKTAFPERDTRFLGQCWTTTDESVVPPAGIVTILKS